MSAEANSGKRRLRSAQWIAGDDLPALLHRASLRGVGLAAAGHDSRPLIGICNSWSEVVHCNTHFRGLAAAVKRGILEAGGLPLEFPTISLGEDLMKPTTMLYRNLMAMDVEESLRAYPFDAVVLLGGCDKTIPAQLMGAASAGIPAIMLTAGPADAGIFRGEKLSSGTDLWRYVEEYRRGDLATTELAALEVALKASPGHCNEMGTASTMVALVEVLGLSLPGSATVAATGPRRVAIAQDTGRQAVVLATQGGSVTDLLTEGSLANAIVALMALGGSTNAVIHLIAIAGRCGIELPLDRFAEIGRDVPLLANVLPSGTGLFEDLDRAGGVPALLHELAPLLDLDAPTLTGPLRTRVAGAPTDDRDVIATLEQPFQDGPAIAVVKGNLAPNGAVIKRSGASRSLLRHTGAALVFDGIADVAARIDDPDLDVTPESVLVLRNVGPCGGPGMPEWGAIPIPGRLLHQGVTDILRISDARMSGTASGAVVLHVAPEAAVGGPLAAVHDGDRIALDVDAGTLELLVTEREIRERLARLGPAEPKYRRGYGALYLDHVLQADRGCDFDFLVARPSEAAEAEPIGLFAGWIGGW
jgi:dihydroxy-acid dehydratase